MNHYLTENIMVMKKLEETVYQQPKESFEWNEVRIRKCVNASKRSSSGRMEICLWYFRVSDYFGIPRETVSISLSYFDRYIVTLDEITENRLLLASLAAYHLAVKIHESRKLCLVTLVKLANNRVKSEEIKLEQDRMMRALSWRLNPPTSESFLYVFVELLNPIVSSQMKYALYTRAQYYTELLVCESCFIYHRPSTVALTSMIKALEHESVSHISAQDCVRFINNVSRKTSLEFDCKEVDDVKATLGNIIDGNSEVKLQKKLNGLKAGELRSKCSKFEGNSHERSNSFSSVIQDLFK